MKRFLMKCMGFSKVVGEESVACGTVYEGIAPILADIVFVHGLNGHRFNTWTKNGIFWPKDLLPQTISNVRIIAFGYDASVMNLFKPASQNNILDHARSLVSDLCKRRRGKGEEERPIIFVAHSLGGILVKDALDYAKQNIPFQRGIASIFLATHGIIFLGTPHRGSQCASLAVIAAKIGRMMLKDANIELPRSLKPNSESLERISEAFERIIGLREVEIYSFFEELAMSSANIVGKIVEKDSGVVGNAFEGRGSIHANHRDMCRFDSESETGYQRVSGVIVDFVKDATEAVRRGNLPKKITSDSKPSMEDHYSQLRDRIESILNPIDFSTDNEVRTRDRSDGTGEWLLRDDEFVQWRDCNFAGTLLLYGIPGCGKTYLMSKILDHIMEHLRRQNLVAVALHFFCDKKVVNTSRRTLSSILKTLAAQALDLIVPITPSKDVEECLVNFEKFSDKQNMLPWLFQSTLETVVRTLKTTAAAGDQVPRVFVLIDALDECDDICDLVNVLKSAISVTEAFHIVLSSRPKDIIRSLIDHNNSGKIYRISIEPQRISPDIELFVRQRMRMLNIRDLGSEKEAAHTVIKGSDDLFLLAYFRLETLKKRTGIHTVRELKEALVSLPVEFKAYYKEALDRLGDMEAYKKRMARRIFIWTLFSKRKLNLGELIEITCVNVSGAPGTERDEKLTLDGFDDLCCGLLVSKKRDDQDDRLAVVEPAHKTVRRYIEGYVWDNTPPLPSLEEHNACQSEIVETCIRYMCCSNSGDMGEYRFLEYAYKHWMLHLFDVKAVDKKLLPVLSNYLGSKDCITWWTSPLTGTLHWSPSELHYFESRYRAWFLGATAESFKSLEPKFAELIVSLLNQQVTMLKEASGTDDTCTLKAMNNLTALYGQRAQYKEAEDLGLEVLDIGKRLWGETHPNTLKLHAQATLLYVYRKQRRWSDAEQYGSRMISACKSTLGQDHPTTHNAMAEYAATLRDTGRWQESENMKEQLLVARVRTLGEENPDTVMAMANLSVTYADLGKWKKAEDLKAEVLAIRKKILGKDHPDTLTAMLNLAASYKWRGLWKEAETLGLETLNGRINALGEEHPYTVWAMALLASTYTENGLWAEAEKWGLQATEACNKLFGGREDETLVAMSNLATTYRNQGRWKDAEAIEVRVFETRKQIHGVNDRQYFTAAANLAFTYTVQGRLEEAEELGLQALEGRKRVFGEDGFDTIVSMQYLSSTYWKQGRRHDAIDLLSDAVRRSAVVCGETHYRTLARKQQLEDWIKEQESNS